ncbi:MAG TPA: PASTA domain-containing protein [Candidatus Hydrogenedentes bacterium]|nr:PASTA domain-containing protein [Candidatus Hydrogenedentota bacterium]
MQKKEPTYTSYRKLTDDRSRLWRTFFISLVLHVLIIAGLYVVTFRAMPKPIEIYKVQLVAGEQPEKTIAEPEPAPPPPPEPPKPEPPKEEPPPEPPKPEPPKPEPPKEQKPAEKPAEAEVEVPDLIGLDLKQAEARLKSADLRLGKVDKKCDNTIKTEKIIAQTPKAGSKVKKGSGVAVTIQGPCEEEKKPEQVAKKTEPKVEEKKPPEKPKEEPKKTPPKDLKPIVPKDEPIKPVTPPKDEPAPKTPAPGKQARANDRVTQSGAAEVPTALQSWLARVMDKVDRNWIIPEGVRRDEVVDIYFVASREGRLLDGPQVVPRDGMMPDAALAQSAITALQRSLPLPPFPDDYPGFEQAVVLGFKASQGEPGL